MSYVALVLDQESQIKLNNMFVPGFVNFETHCHHMTINMGGFEDGPAIGLENKKYELKVIAISQDDKVCAVMVETDAPSNNEIKHITIATNVDTNGRPKDSKNLKDWIPVDSFIVQGEIKWITKIS
jgi:hypothetical protein